MKNLLPLLFQTSCAIVISQNRSSAAAAMALQHSAVEVRWIAATNPWPSNLWVYRVEPTVFSEAVISNLMGITGYTAQDEASYGTNGLLFSNPKRTGSLRISFPEGSIDYWTTAGSYGPTNLAKAVPGEKELFRLTTNLIDRLGIGLSELVRKTDSTQPSIHYLETQSVFSYKDSFITNITSREAHFSRSVDGMEFIGFNRGGNGVIEYGDHGKILKIWLSWRKIIRDKSYPAVTPEAIMRWIREGKVLPQSPPGSDSPPITGWAGVKSVTINQARLCCLGAAGTDKPVFPSFLRPFAALEATVDMVTTNFAVGIDCPAFAEHESTKDRR